MKKFITTLILLVVVAAISMSAFAATGINKFEQEVLDLLDSSVELGVNDWDFEIPQKYINTAKNYFAGDCDMTEAEKNEIIALINKGIDVVKKDAASQKNSGKEFNLSKMSEAARTEVLNAGKAACEAVDLQLTYNSTNNAVVITQEGSSTPVFESTAVVKATGEAITVDATFVGIAVVTCLALVTGVMYVVSKKSGLWVK